ncbi:Ig-like domain-containing protein [Hymenobacter sp.]|uniref:Ig-like domain-containing protein n=1 Tax=Hymenobacter sp. TaxID=1898978 RepID=UPI002EDAC81C
MRAQAPNVSYTGPITITQGGVYTGNYQSLDSNVPCIRIETTDPVILEGCVLSGAGDLVRVATEGADVTVRQCRGYGLQPSVNGQARGRFLDIPFARRLTIEHNYFEHTSGIVVYRWRGNGAPNQTLTVRYNQASNIDGRWRNNQGSTRSSFLLLNTVQQLANVDISYNQVINEANQSLVEDNINFYNTSGTPQSPLQVHDNYVQGAYPFPATGASFTGTGLTTDGDGLVLATAASFIEAHHNQFVSTCNAAMNIAAGHDIYFHDNRMVTSGLLPDGSRLNATYAATAVFNYYQAPSSIFFNNRIEQNTIGYVRWGANNPFTDRQDLSPGACSTCTGNTHLPNPITLQSEQNEWTLWQQKLQANNVIVGVTGSSTPINPTLTPGRVANASFDNDGQGVQSPQGWNTWGGARGQDYADYSESYPNAHSGTYHGTHYSDSNYEVYTYQVVSNLPNGQYKLRAWTKGSSQSNSVYMVAKDFGGNTITTSIPATSGGAAGPWQQVEVSNIQVSNGRCEIGFYSQAAAYQWLYFDDVELVPQSSTTGVAPTVSLTSPANNSAAVLGTTLTVAATATDADGTIAKVEFFEGGTKLGEDTSAPYELSWTPAAAGTFNLTARATDNSNTATTSTAQAVTITLPAPVSQVNLLANPSFDNDGQGVQSPQGWNTWGGARNQNYADYSESYGNSRTGPYHGTHYHPQPYEVYTYQTASNLADGLYTLQAWVKRSGGQSVVVMLAKNFGDAQVETAIPTTAGGASGAWVQVTLRDINVRNGRCEIGFYSRTNAPDQWLYFEDVEFFNQANTAGREVVSAAQRPAAEPATTATVSIYPNPAHEQFAITTTYEQAGPLDIWLVTLQGLRVAHYQQQAQAGANKITVPANSLPAGTYLLQIQNGKDVRTARVQLLAD